MYIRTWNFMTSISILYAMVALLSVLSRPLVHSMLKADPLAKKNVFSSNPEGIQMAKWNSKLNGSIAYIFIWIPFAISSFVIPNELTFEHAVVENEKVYLNWMLHFEKPRFVRKYVSNARDATTNSDFPNFCCLLIKP